MKKRAGIQEKDEVGVNPSLVPTLHQFSVSLESKYAINVSGVRGERRTTALEISELFGEGIP